MTVTNADLSAQMADHDDWEKSQSSYFEADHNRIDLLERAVIQLNHFSEHIEKLELAEWKGHVSGRLEMMTWFMGITAAGVIAAAIKFLFFSAP